MSANQLSLALDSPAHGGCSAVAGSASSWVESWHNFDLCFGKLSPEHQRAQLDETAKWLFTGRRWPLNPSDRQHEHALHWFPKVARIMHLHGWDFTWEEREHYGYVVKWTLRHAPEHHIGGCGPSAQYAGITSAAICRRKARYYGLWQNVEAARPIPGARSRLQNRESSHGSQSTADGDRVERAALIGRRWSRAGQGGRSTGSAGP